MTTCFLTGSSQTLYSYPSNSIGAMSFGLLSRIAPNAPTRENVSSLPGLRLESAVQVDAVADQPREVRARSKRVHEPRRVPGGAGLKPRALENQHIPLAVQREVIRGARTHDAAADDDVARGRRKRLGHPAYLGRMP